jgi:hypothetical protein
VVLEPQKSPLCQPLIKITDNYGEFVEWWLAGRIKVSTRRNNLLQCHFVNKKPTWTAPGLNPGLRYENRRRLPTWEIAPPRKLFWHDTLPESFSFTTVLWFDSSRVEICSHPLQSTRPRYNNTEFRKWTWPAKFRPFPACFLIFPCSYASGLLIALMMEAVNTSVWNIGQFLPDYTAQHPWRQSSYSPPWEPEISCDV